MHRRTLVALSAAALLAAGLTFPSAFAQNNPPAAAAPAGPTRVGVVNPSKVFQAVKETQELQAELSTRRDAAQREAATRQEKIKALQQSRAALVSGTPDAKKADEEVLRAAVDYDVFARVQQATLERENKERVKALYDKILKATSEVAAQKGVDLVVTSVEPRLPDNLDQIKPEQLDALLSSRNVLFVKPGLDLTQDVISRLDAAYAAPARQ